MADMACVNGELTTPEQATVPVYDRGFLFGDSVYEVCRIYQGRCWLEEEHLARLKRSLNELQFPPYDFETLMERVYRTIRAGFIEEGLVYIQITRGVAPRTHIFPNPPVVPTEVIITRPYDDGPTDAFRKSGVPVGSQPDIRWKRCDIKTTNLLGNVLALEAAHREGYFEAVLVDAQGLVTESTHSSLMWVRNGRLEGTPEGPEILIGMTRHSILKMAEGLKIPFVEMRVTLDELKSADEVFLAGTSIEVMPVVKIDDATVGGGEPGPITRRLQQAHREALDAWLVRSTATTAS